MLSVEKILKVAVVQTIVDSSLVWNDKPRMDLYEANAIWRQVQSAFASFQELSGTNRPDIVILPELAVAAPFESRLKKYGNKIGAIIIAGLDFVSLDEKHVANKALFYIPRNWPKEKNMGVVKSQTFYFGKHFASNEEKQGFKQWNVDFVPCNEFYIVDLAEYGKLGVAICADFYDIERYAIYKGRIQHLLIIANNQDVKSFCFLAEAISRLVFCNVIICNSGHYGGSVCFTLAKQEYARYRYKHEGKDLFTTQVVDLPVADLFKAQNGDQACVDKFKSAPPGYKYMYEEDTLQEERE